MNTAAIFICDTPISRQWQLGPLPPPTGDIALIGWHVEPHSVDSGVPTDVRRLLGRALASIAKLSFPVSASAESNTDPRATDDQRRQLPFSSLADRFKATLNRQSAISLITTCPPDTAIQLFDAPGFSWEWQAQVVVLSERNATPPPLTRDTLFALIGDAWTQHAPALLASGVVGVMRPGVDGDVVGILSLTPAFKQALIAALEIEAQRANFTCSRVTEPSFAGLL
ncbi:hypothetical protein [Burkholderia ubonensis]|uniref:Uncharacterized protein n=1 Tax=Burkholderia ubonensis subsp. mesacidophila TaxID=265293 RepID=A0A2A4F7I2_9BURK|nr:hypothetical protein [Burkholderia ubonensis]PCE29115.1 hypothetical protein BZL54_28160 [Burkholderia ubonensis subsp. mesacidophila]